MARSVKAPEFGELDLIRKGAVDPRWFLEDCCGFSLWEKQIEIAEALVHHNVAVPAVFGVGKTYVSALISIWWLYTRPFSQVITTAPTGRQVKDQLWAEIRNGFFASKLPLGGECLTTELKVDPEFPKWFATGFATNEEHIDKFTGYHAVGGTLLIFDQACGIHKEIWKGGEGLVTTYGSRWLALTNTTDEASEMANLCLPDRVSAHGHICEDPECTGCGGWKVIKITAHDSPNVKAGMTKYPGILAHDFVEKKKKVWRVGEPLWDIYVEANFVIAGDMTVLHPSMVPEILETNEVEPDYDNIIIGVDVADEGTDYSVCAVGLGNKLGFIDYVMGNDTMQVVKFVEETWEKVIRLTGGNYAPIDIRIDKIGVGKGVVDRLAQKGYPVTGVNVGTAPINPEEFINRRIEMSWALRQLAEGYDISWKPLWHTNPEVFEMLKDDMKIRYRALPSQRLALEDKKEFRRRMRRSPDFWDALMFAFGDNAGIPTVTGIELTMQRVQASLTEQLNNIDPVKAQESLEIMAKLAGRGFIEDSDFTDVRIL